VNYDSAGTVEFVAGQDKSFYFLEMNTRLQVEHPVTELITGLDLVEQMIRSAYGEKLAFEQKDLKINGWAMESRIYAEDPYRKFLPSIGRLVRYDPPVEGAQDGYTVRNDAGVREGDEISMFYDPMISKLCTWGKTREAAIAGMGRALEDFHIEGLGHNIPFLSAVMDHPVFQSGKLATSFIAEEYPEGFQGAPASDACLDLMTASAAAMHLVQQQRVGGNKRTDWIVVIGHRQIPVSLSGGGESVSVRMGDQNRVLELTDIAWRPGQPLFKARLDGKPFSVTVAPAPEGFTIRHRATKLKVLVLTPRSAELHTKLPEKKAADTSRMIISPMPGLVVSMDVVLGQQVREGEIVCVIEAMKMQNIIRAERDGVVKTVSAKGGDSVAADEVLVEFA
jgi:propionyl-CoA carboxylase alpha chain